MSTSMIADIMVSNEGTVFLLVAITGSGAEWLKGNLPEDCPRFGKAYVVEHRFAEPIVDGAMCDGLRVRSKPKFGSKPKPI